MDELQIESKPETGPLNLYAKAFFWIWGLTCVTLAGFRTDNPTYS